jgi:hypothetical protein
LNVIFDFFESAFPIRGGWLLLPDPVARAKAREAANAINSIMWYGATWLLLIHNI